MRPPPQAQPVLAARVRELFRAAGFDADGIRRALRTGGGPLVEYARSPVHRRRLAALDGPLPVLAALFLLGDAVETAAAEERLEDGLTELAEAGLVTIDGATCVATARVVPHDDLLIASDVPRAGGAEHVAGLHGPSSQLANLTVRRPVERALDLGTGNGIQAILLSRHARRVVATDLNERALAYAAFNCALNGAENVELRHGSFFEPVEGERFDLAVSNPPYVISPDMEFLFRDGGLGRDGVSEAVVRGLPAVLAEGGFGALTLSWANEGETVDARPRGWLEGAGCDAWILHTGTDDPLATAASWNRELSARPEEYDAAIERWLAYYEESGIASIAYGNVLLRRREGENWIRSTPVPHARIGPAGAQVERLFAAQDFLGRDPDLLGAQLRPVPEAILEQQLRPHEDGWARADRTLRLDGGLGFAAELDEPSALFVTALGEGASVDEAASRAAATLGLEPGAATEAATELARRLLELGFLEPRAP